MSARLQQIVTDMAHYLDRAALKTIILNAIPEKQEREFFPTEPTRRPGWASSGSRGRAFSMPAHEEAYLAEFRNELHTELDDPAEYLDKVRDAVQTEDPAAIDDVQSDFDEYFTVTTPVFMQPILILFKKWCELSNGHLHGLSVDPPPIPATHGDGRDGNPPAPHVNTANLSALLHRLAEAMIHDI